MSSISADENDDGIGLCGWILTAVSWAIVVVTLPFSLCVCFKVIIHPPPPSPNLQVLYLQGVPQNMKVKWTISRLSLIFEIFCGIRMSTYFYVYIFYCCTICTIVNNSASSGISKMCSAFFELSLL